ncbi:hypothetical protein [Pleurocapsa sp. FMAR1]|uniref:hypothetical protein n=1 Tax=Pleurocapsa sp. FMAR1 TaxID=3040204 RepID=UPI0029C77B8F|nr:hypothetical protein [Pleurocapsa sp. FMAR1]
MVIWRKEMGNRFQVEVNESKKELRHRLHHSVTSSSRERLQMLYWLKQDAIALLIGLLQDINMAIGYAS